MFQNSERYRNGNLAPISIPFPQSLILSMENTVHWHPYFPSCLLTKNEEIHACILISLRYRKM